MVNRRFSHRPLWLGPTPWCRDAVGLPTRARDRQGEFARFCEPPLNSFFGLRQALKSQPALEVKRRLQDLLAELEPKAVGGTPQCLHELRAVQALESIDTAEARQELQILAKGVVGARLTVEAQTALARLAKRSATRP